MPHVPLEEEYFTRRVYKKRYNLRDRSYRNAYRYQYIVLFAMIFPFIILLINLIIPQISIQNEFCNI